MGKSNVLEGGERLDLQTPRQRNPKEQRIVLRRGREQRVLSSRVRQLSFLSMGNGSAEFCLILKKTVAGFLFFRGKRNNVIRVWGSLGGGTGSPQRAL